MSSLNTSTLPIARPPRKPRRCGICGASGHDKRNCPSRPAATAVSVVQNGSGGQNDITIPDFPAPVTLTTIQEPLSVDWEKVLYVVFDLETTGVRRNRDEIIEIAAIVLDKNCIAIEDAVFVHFVKPTIPIPQFITALTSITNNDVQNAETFVEVGAAFLRFMQQHADQSNDPVDHIILVGHNGKVFDIVPLQIYSTVRVSMRKNTLQFQSKAAYDHDAPIAL